MHPIVGSPPPLQCPAVLSVHHCGHPLPLDVWKLHQVMAEGIQKWLRRSQKSQMHCFKMKASHAETVKIRKKNLEKDPNRHSKLFEWNTSNHAVGWKTLERSQNLWFQNDISSGFVLFSSFRKLVMDMWWSATRNVQPVQPTGSSTSTLAPRGHIFSSALWRENQRFIISKTMQWDKTDLLTQRKIELKKDRTLIYHQCSRILSLFFGC